MKQTAVEWLALYIKGITNLNCDEVINQAIAMEKEQIIDAATWGGLHESAEQYYNETYSK
jgi:hypothetical protein